MATRKRSHTAMDHIVMPASKANNSLWASSTSPSLKQNLQDSYDIAIIGGGFSGLWSAFHLTSLDPSLKIAIFEAKSLGFGASGRNGGWASSEYPVYKETLKKRIGSARTDQLFEALNGSIDEIGAFSSHHHEVGFAKSGSLYFARNKAQLKRLKGKVDGANTFLSASEVKERLNVTGVLGGVFNPICATINPFKLVQALASHLQKKGVSIFEGTWATPVSGGVLANSSFVKAPAVIQATEAFGAPGREFIPLYSLMVATEPLNDSTWREIGNSERFTFAENSHMVNYAQRTIDNRIAIGGRGATYPFGSRLRESKESTVKVHETIRSLLKSWFPVLQSVNFTHSWGGAVAVTRNWEPYVQWNPHDGFGRLGGYAGDGVTMSNLAAKVLAHEILDVKNELRNLHFVNQKIKKWEPEPIRYLGVNSLVKLSGIADAEERITGRASLLNRVIEPLILR
ncbi:MAG: FAD-dependent oxidoreductase [Candidatus Nanopelagicaceae bacterium]|nr:FAD-dependent oxidoreductase [Candidatus Nanopelagicaceae bacterium]